MGGDTPKLSVVMPVHDAEATLAEAVDSVLSRQLNGVRAELEEERGLNKVVRKQEAEIRELRSSTVWKVGRFITWIPRKIKSWLLARRRNG